MHAKLKNIVEKAAKLRGLAKEMRQGTGTVTASDIRRLADLSQTVAEAILRYAADPALQPKQK